MDELVKSIAKKTGIPEEAARTAVKMVVDFLKTKLPAPIASQIDAVISGKGEDILKKGLGGLMG